MEKGGKQGREKNREKESKNIQVWKATPWNRVLLYSLEVINKVVFDVEQCPYKFLNRCCVYILKTFLSNCRDYFGNPVRKGRFSRCDFPVPAVWNPIGRPCKVAFHKIISEVQKRGKPNVA